MTEFVFRRSRKKGGKRILARSFTGCCAWMPGQKPIRVPLHTSDIEVARRRLHRYVIERQREAEGIIAPRGIREALTTPLSELLAEYRAYLMGRGLSVGYVRDTIRRIERVNQEAGWRLLADIRPDSFLKWRAKIAA